ncbi:MAG TPA: class I SAM-dependent methyltransferase [Gaiellaceae bacterium]
MSRIYSEEAELYDIAFDWDLSDEAAWLVERLGPECRSVLEPGCGSGRMLAALAAQGLEVVGIDTSEEMLRLARARGCEAVHADMTNFDLGRRFGGAVSVVSTVGVLGVDRLGPHLAATARHLEPGARYLVQQGVFAGDGELWRSEWEAERGDTKLHVVWEALDRERSRSRMAILAGPRTGEVVEEVHVAAYWTVKAWRDVIAASPFTQVACYDEEAEVELDNGGSLLWHELAAP